MSDTRKRDVRNRLLKALDLLGVFCQAPKNVKESYDDFLVQQARGPWEERCPWRELWPESGHLHELDSAVEALDTIMVRKTLLLPRWKRYVRVNNRWPGIGLVRKVNWFVKKAR